MIELLEKQQPIPHDILLDLQSFLEKLANKDVQAFGVCLVDRKGDVHSFYHSAPNEYKLNTAVDYLQSRVKGGL